VQTLRADAGDLRQRADEYLFLWSGNKAGFTTEGNYYQVTDEGRQQKKAKYNEMVTALQQARDEILPLMPDLEKLQAAFDAKTDREKLRADVQQARQRETRGTAHLKDGLARLDELKAMFAANPPNQGR
jgi:chromosome segregation ATPase